MRHDTRRPRRFYFSVHVFFIPIYCYSDFCILSYPHCTSSRFCFVLFFVFITFHLPSLSVLVEKAKALRCGEAALCYVSETETCRVSGQSIRRSYGCGPCLLAGVARTRHAIVATGTS